MSSGSAKVTTEAVKDVVWNTEMMFDAMLAVELCRLSRTVVAFSHMSDNVFYHLENVVASNTKARFYSLFLVTAFSSASTHCSGG